MSPKPVERLEKTLARVAKEQGIDQERLRRWVSFLALCGLLERAVNVGILTTYYLKGGVAMELRFAGAARATKDMDLGLEGNRMDRLKVFEPAVSGLAEMGLPITSPIRCLGLSEQLAQKLHACTGPQSKGRARDILDILLIDLLGRLDYSQVRVAADQVFSQRATHVFPPEITIPVAWRAELEALAIELGYPVTAPAAIEEKFRALVESIAGAGSQ